MASGGGEGRRCRVAMAACVFVLGTALVPVGVAQLVGTSLPEPVADALADPFVATTLVSPAFARIQAAHADDEGLLAIAPVPAGHVAILYAGAAPAGAHGGFEHGLPVQLYRHQEPEVLIEPVDPALLPDLTSEDDHWNKPLVPGPSRGIGPGSHILIGRSDGTFRCTANFIFRDAQGTLYLGTAGHCLLADVDESTDAGFRQPLVRVCLDGCLGATLASGDFERIGLVKYAISKGVGSDFGFVSIPEELHHRVRPWTWHVGGPIGQTVGAPATGTPLVHYGNGVGIGETFATQGRAAVSIGGSGGDLGGLGWATGGDSGSPVLTAFPHETSVGDKAAGDLTHSIVTVGAPFFFGTTVTRGIALAQAGIGVQFQLVLEDEV